MNLPNNSHSNHWTWGGQLAVAAVVREWVYQGQGR